MLYLSLFITFFEIGLFGFGGGYGMLSLIQTEVVHNHHWITTGEFTDIVAVRIFHMSRMMIASKFAT